MVPALVFLAVATLLGCLIRAAVGLRLRSVSQRPDVSDDDVCGLRQARRISGVAVAVAVVGLAVLGVASVLLAAA